MYTNKYLTRTFAVKFCKKRSATWAGRMFSSKILLIPVQEKGMHFLTYWDTKRRLTSHGLDFLLFHLEPKRRKFAEPKNSQSSDYSGRSHSDLGFPSPTNHHTTYINYLNVPTCSLDFHKKSALVVDSVCLEMGMFW